MSGGSGSGGGFVPTGPIGSGSRKPGSDDPCEIRITLPLSAIQRANLTGLAKGDKLPVELLATRGTDTVIVRNPKRNNGVVGQLPTKMYRLSLTAFTRATSTKRRFWNTLQQASKFVLPANESRRRGLF